MIWATSCLSKHHKKDGDELTSTEINKFLKYISKKNEDWQVQQAADAIRIYNFYARHNTKTAITETPEVKEQWRLVADEMKKMIRLKQLRPSTESTYLRWLRSFYLHTKGLSPLTLGSNHVKNFLTHIAVEKKVAKSTQNQAFNAILFFFKHVLEKDLDDIQDTVRSKRGRRLPVVLTREEIKSLFSHLDGLYSLMARLIYGGGLRLNEALNLRIKDVDFERNTVSIISGKGDKDRQTLLAQNVKKDLAEHIKHIRNLYESDRKNNVPGVELPNALERKYPNAGKEWPWQWLFPSKVLSKDPRSQIIRRWHMYPTTLQRHIKKAAHKAHFFKRITVHTLRHSFATHLIEDGYDIRTVQELLGHSSLRTTMIYTHVAMKNMLGVKSPLDSIT